MNLYILDNLKNELKIHNKSIYSIVSYPALRLAPQQVHQWYVQPGPLVLGSTPLNSSTRITALPHPAYQRGGLPRLYRKN